MATSRFLVECIGWCVIAATAWWLVVLISECSLILLGRWWKEYLRFGRYILYFRAAGFTQGTIESFTLANGEKFDNVIWLLFRKRAAPPTPDAN